MPEPAAARPLVITVIPNHNGGEALLETIGALLDTDYSPHEIILVDDASTDGTVDRVPHLFPGVTVRRGAANRGFAPVIISMYLTRSAAASHSLFRFPLASNPRTGPPSRPFDSGKPASGDTITTASVLPLAATTI